MCDLNKPDIYLPTHLIKFTWEKYVTEGGGNRPTSADIEEMRRIMREENARLEAKQE